MTTRLALSVLVMALLLAGTAAGAGARLDAVTPVGGNGALLLGRDRSDLLFLLRPGSRRPEVVRGVFHAGGGAAWSPDGHRLAVASDAGLAIFDPRTRGRKLIASSGAGPNWSPDGSRVAYSARGVIWIKTLGLARARRFARGSDPSWSPDGKAIAYRGRSGIFVKALAGRTRRVLRDYSDPSCTVGHYTPAWSPSGVGIAFTASFVCSNEAGEVSDSTEIAKTGSPPTSLAGGNEDGPWGPVWSPNGRLLAFTDDSGVGPHVAITRPRRRASIRLRGFWEPLDWQPLCTLRGGSGADRIRARTNADLACGFRGDDVIEGGAAQDRLFGEEGNDRFLARDGEFDVVGCGPGSDTVVADRQDLVGRDCERVVRR